VSVTGKLEIVGYFREKARLYVGPLGGPNPSKHERPNKETGSRMRMTHVAIYFQLVAFRKDASTIASQCTGSQIGFHLRPVSQRIHRGLSGIDAYTN
jgi:hypothetical protein